MVCVPASLLLGVCLPHESAWVPRGCQRVSASASGVNDPSCHWSLDAVSSCAAVLAMVLEISNDIALKIVVCLNAQLSTL